MFRAARAATIRLTMTGVIVFGGLLSIAQPSERNFEARAQAFFVHEIERQYEVALELMPPVSQLLGSGGSWSRC